RSHAAFPTRRSSDLVDFEPARGNVRDWGDDYGNRVDRFLAGVAYLDGERPSLIMARGYYAKTAVAAYDFRDGELAMRWLFDTARDRKSTRLNSSHVT